MDLVAPREIQQVNSRVKMALTLQVMYLLDAPRSPLKAFARNFLGITVTVNGYNRIKKVF